MNSFITRLASSPVSRLIIAIVAVHFVIGIFVHVYWTTTGNANVLQLYFDNEGALLFLLLSGTQLAFAVFAYREFSSQELFGAAWFYISLASVCLFVGTVFRHVLAVHSVLNPLIYSQFGKDDQLRTLLGNIGTVIGGPIQMILLGTGLYMAIRGYKKLGMLARLTPLDLVLIGASMFYAVVVIVGIIRAVVSNPSGVTVEHALTWPGDYLISLLLLEAVFLRRSAVEMGQGFVSKVWGAFAAGIFLTAFCSLMNWLTAYGFLTWQQTAFVWYLWYPASAAFALGPTYQWEATRTANLRLAKQVDDLELPIS